MKKGFTLIELLIVVAIIAILAAIAVPNFLEAQVRSKVSRAKSDMRSLATGIESYYVDNNQYPLSARTSREAACVGNVNYFLASNQGNTAAATTLRAIPTFSAQQNASPRIGTLTTPVAYITSYFADPFLDTKGASFGYYSDTNGWILWSAGPDTDQATQTQLGGPGSTPSVETVYNSQISQPSMVLTVGTRTGTGGGCYTYDPTNGTVSPGDVWRVKQ